VSHFPRELTQRFQQRQADHHRRIATLDSRTSSIDSGIPVHALPAVIDSGYTGGNPMVYANGATALTGPYPFLAPYVPQAGDAVTILPVRTTWLILGLAGPVPWTTLTAFTGGWTGSIAYRVNGDEIALDVKIAPGTVLDGTAVCNLPAPASFKRVALQCDSIKVNGSAFEAPGLYISAAGQAQIWGVGTAASYLQGTGTYWTSI
jgi:hypothetical protein